MGVQAEWAECSLQGTAKASSTKPIILKHSSSISEVKFFPQANA